ncbi:MAG: phosphotransferase [Bacteroidales bacterium]|nr:phosphotransferase [Candidatus Hennigimonas equi]
MTKIDLNDWMENGAGYFGTSYVNRTDETLLLKLLKPGFPPSMMDEEHRMALMAYTLGIPTPKPYDLVTDGECSGIIYQRFPDKKSYARMLGEHPELSDSLAGDLAALARRLHSTPCPTDKFSDIKDKMRSAVLNNNFHDDYFKGRALSLLESLPDGDTCIHGDLHFGNVILSGGNSYFIDLGNFCYGHPYFDLGMTICIMEFASLHPDVFSENYHCTPEQGIHFMETFLRAYFGSESVLEDIVSQLRPYAAFCQISSELAMGVPFTEEEIAPTTELLLR